MNADVKGAYEQLRTSYRAFTHNDKPMTYNQVKEVLEYAIAKGYKHTGQLSDSEVDSIINKVQP